MTAESVTAQTLLRVQYVRQGLRKEAEKAKTAAKTEQI